MAVQSDIMWRVSYDMFFQRFRDGDADSIRLDEQSWGELRRATVLRDADNCPARLASNGATADIYGIPAEPGPLDGFMVNHMEPGAADLIMRIAVAGGATILLLDGPVLITDPDQADHLPESLRRDVRSAQTGTELLRAIGE